jgi:hypothetical protein
MTLFIGQRSEETAPKLRWEGWPAKQRPGKEFHGLEFVVCKSSEASGSMFPLPKQSGPWESLGAPTHAQSGIACGPFDFDRSPRRGVRQKLSCGIEGRRQFRLEVASLENSEAIGLHVVRGGRRSPGFTAVG